MILGGYTASEVGQVRCCSEQPTQLSGGHRGEHHLKWNTSADTAMLRYSDKQHNEGACGEVREYNFIMVLA